MYHFVLQILIMLSLGLMVYMAARKIPQITDTVPEESTGQPTGFWHQVELILGKLPLDKFDLLFSQFLEKNIRKIKLLLARFDNYLAHHLEQFKKIKQRAHRKQQKKFALFEGQEEGAPVPVQGSDEVKSVVTHGSGETKAASAESFGVANPASAQEHSVATPASAQGSGVTTSEKPKIRTVKKEAVTPEVSEKIEETTTPDQSIENTK